jgi:hypothetical protein
MRKILARSTTMLARGERPHCVRRFASLFVLVSALSLIATVTISSGAAPAVSGHGTLSSGAHFNVNAGSYAFQRVTSPFFIDGKVVCVFQSGTFAGVGGTITDSSNPDIVGPQHFFLVYFSGQTATHPNIDPQSDPDVSGLLPADFPATCPSQAPSDAIFFTLTKKNDFIKYGGT